MVDEPDAISHEVVVRLPQEEAFHLFAYGFASWWPPEYTWSGTVLETIGFETFAGGRCTEHGPLGFQCDWGRVLVWSPPQRLVLAWQIGPNRQPQPDPENASRIDILFRSRSAGTTRLLLTHRDIRRHGKGAARYRQALGSALGWPLILECYADAAMART